MLNWLRRARKLSVHEEAALDSFASMSINEVRKRADEFAAAQAQYGEWLDKRRTTRAHPPDGDELDGYTPEVQYGDPAANWRRLEHRLRACDAWSVGDLGRREAISWAKQLNAFSDAFDRPARRPVGPPRPSPEVRERR